MFHKKLYKNLKKIYIKNILKHKLNLKKQTPCDLLLNQIMYLETGQINLPTPNQRQF
jgi:hypothetical protein